MMKDSAAIIRNAWRNRLVVPAFNIPYLPMMQPVIQAVRDQNAFAFVAVARLEWVKFEAESPEAVYDEFVAWHDPDCVRLHLDHVPAVDEDDRRVDYIPILERALQLGYPSVMFDGSRLPLQENIECGRRAVALARSYGAACELELGAVTGHESAPAMSYEELFRSRKGFTDVEEARLFVRQTGCDWLSVAVGNVHGAIAKGLKDRKKVSAELDLDHLAELSKATGVPLVLHGGSGVTRRHLLDAVSLGVAKVNVGTEIRQPYEKTLSTTSSPDAAQRAVYERTVWILKDCLEAAGKRNLILEGEPFIS